jgi:hypothetical protein
VVEGFSKDLHGSMPTKRFQPSGMKNDQVKATREHRSPEKT